MSRNNRWYLFFNRATLSLMVYELREKPTVDYAQSFMADDSPGSKSDKAYEFAPAWQIDYDKTSMFQHLYTLNVDPIGFFSTHGSEIKIDDQGCVKLCYVENLPGLDK